MPGFYDLGAGDTSDRARTKFLKNNVVLAVSGRSSYTTTQLKKTPLLVYALCGYSPLIARNIAEFTYFLARRLVAQVK
jgi:hypothetical protein